MRLIDADALIKYWEQDCGRKFVADYFIHTIEVAPTIEERPTGEWVHDKKSLWDIAKCSLCGETTIGYRDSNYCPKCGAKMKEEE